MYYAFQSTHSLRSATQKSTPLSLSSKFQSTHSLRSATYYEGAKRFAYVVSIHALLAECDRELGDWCTYDPVSIHALLAECD